MVVSSFCELRKRMIESLRNGLWLTRERMRLVSAILLVFYALSTGFLFATSDGRLDRFDRPLGTDFSGVWTAGVSVLEGHPESPFDPQSHAAKQRSLFGDPDAFFPWSYPPFFLALAAALALLPYALALIAWQGATLALYLGLVRRILPGRDALLLAAAFPAVFINIGHGQNGFLSAALLGGGLVLLDRRPWVAGVLIGLLAYKPQFGLLIPIALIAGFYWRTIVAAALTVVAMSLATFEAFGWSTWQAFFDCLDFSRRVNIEGGATGWEKIQTVFAAVRMWGGSVELAYAVQTVSAASCAAALLVIWGGRADWRLRGAALMVAALLATPYALDYDMMLLGPAIAMVASYGMQRGFLPWEKSILAITWIVPILARNIAGVTLVPVGLLSMLAFAALILWRACLDMGLVGWCVKFAEKHAALVAQMRAFLVVGVIGFVVDAGLTMLLSSAGGLSPYAARIPAVLCAATTTWLLNRRHTFRSQDVQRAREFVRYLSVSVVGTTLNYTVYSLVLMGIARMGLTFVTQNMAIVAAVTCGSLVSMSLTFTGFRLFAFQRERARHAA